MLECRNEAQESNSALKPIFNWPHRAIIFWLLVSSIIVNSFVGLCVQVASLNFVFALNCESLTLLQSLVSSFIYNAILLIFISYILHKKRISFHKFGIHFKREFKTLGFYWTLGMALNFLFFHLQIDLFKYVTPLPADLLKTHWPIILGVHLFIAGLLGPFVEEILFRGILFRSLINHTTANSAIVINTIIFVLCHIGGIGSIFYFIGIVLTGGVLCVIYLKTRNITNAIIFHAAWNITGILQIYFRIFEALPT